MRYYKIRNSCAYLCLLCVVAFLALVGCQTTGNSHSLQVGDKIRDITVSATGEIVPVPQPEIEPVIHFDANHVQWLRGGKSAFWRIDIDNGRYMILDVAPILEAGKTELLISKASIFSPNKTLVMEQFYGRLKVGGYNHNVLLSWIKYDAEGKRKEVLVMAEALPDGSPKIIEMILYGNNGEERHLSLIDRYISSRDYYVTPPASN